MYEGMKARFTACASGWPEPEVEWFLNGDRIYPNDRTQIEIEPNGKNQRSFDNSMKQFLKQN